MKALILLSTSLLPVVDSFSSWMAPLGGHSSAPSAPITPPLQQVQPTQPVTDIDSYETAFSIIDDCTIQEESNENLFRAVKYIEHNSYKFYNHPASKTQALWNRAHGSWKLILSTGSPTCQSFHPPPAFLPFSYAMIDDEHFGNGVGLNDHTIWLSLLHKHDFNHRIRHMVVQVQHVFLGGRKLELPAFFSKASKLLRERRQRQPNETTTQTQKNDNKPPPTFVILGASEHALIARGNQSGGLAIWKRMPHDIRPIAYKGYEPKK
ncbi:expressed unknown protein [Seminavis robusta]|uniref:Uncharacterized protein n=1 Tax=Seminavis robusta TaxID=568900 RepID=A0A9N8F0S8_9STRA|nr:expressed unknown protein [Seminavis robusta]|eukprot:Sro2403_g326390.1 n/a (265) ;mRNA; f:5835-6629